MALILFRDKHSCISDKKLPLSQDTSNFGVASVIKSCWSRLYSRYNDVDNSSIIFMIFCTAEILAFNVIPSNNNPIENCCDLGFGHVVFSEIVNKPKVYKLKKFCNNHRSSLTYAYCDTVTDGGGWLVVQRRMNGTENFQRNWIDYERGFGSLTGEL